MVTYGPITTKHLHKPHKKWPFIWKILALPDKLLFPFLILFWRKKVWVNLQLSCFFKLFVFIYIANYSSLGIYLYTRKILCTKASSYLKILETTVINNDTLPCCSSLFKLHYWEKKKCFSNWCLLQDRVFLFLLDRQAPSQRSTHRSASVASYPACRGGLTVDDGS